MTLAGMKRDRGMSIALLGPDGAGKTTLARALAAEPSVRALRVYMGRNPAARTVSLPGGVPGDGAGRGRGNAARGARARGKRFLHRLAGQWYRYAVARWHRTRGGVVVFDRYIYAPRMLRPSDGAARRIRRWLLHAGAPAPDLVVILDAPPEVLLERKREHDLERLEQMRRDYARLARQIPRTVVMDATRGESELKDALLALIREQRDGHDAPEREGECRVRT